MPTRNLILDWSGTLVDDLGPVVQTTNHVLERFGQPALTRDEFRREFCLPVRKFYLARLPQVALAEVEQLFLNHYPAYRNEIRPLPQTLGFLQFCAASGRRVFVASSADRQTYDSQMTRFGLQPYITKAYLGIADKTRQIHEILAENALRPDETMFVGDMEHDIAAGKAGGVRTCAVLTGYNHAAALHAAEPDLVCADLGELQQALAEEETVLAHG